MPITALYPIPSVFHLNIARIFENKYPHLQKLWGVPDDQGCIFPGVVGTMVTKEAGLSEAGLEVEGAAEAGCDADEAADVADGSYADA